jgi:four helix bundle protein
VNSVKSKVSNYRQFDVYKLAYKASIRLHKLTYDFPKVEQFGGLADQIRRASKSICGNLAEGYGRSFNSPQDFGRYVLIALGSADEMQVWLDYAVDLEFIDRKIGNELQDTYQMISKMLVNLHRSTTKLSRKIV